MSNTVLAGSVDGPLPLIFCFKTIDNEVIYNLTVNQSVIRRYVEVIRTLRLFSPCFCAHFGTFLDITLVFVVITFWFMADFQITIYSFIWYQFQIDLRPSTDPQEAFLAQKYNIFMTCSQHFHKI